jgi:hypothetical protein
VRLCAAGKSHYLPNQNVMQIGRRSVCANAIPAARVICLDLIVDCFDTQERRRSTRVCLVKSSALNSFRHANPHCQICVAANMCIFISHSTIFVKKMTFIIVKSSRDIVRHYF